MVADSAYLPIDQIGYYYPPTKWFLETVVFLSPTARAIRVQTCVLKIPFNLSLAGRWVDYIIPKVH